MKAKFTSAISVLMIVAVLAISMFYIAPASALSLAQINSVSIVGHDVYINASGPCPAVFYVTKTVTSTKINITVKTEYNPLAGVCAPGAPMDNTDIVVHIDLQKNKEVWVNGVKYGTMLYKTSLRK